MKEGFGGKTGACLNSAVKDLNSLSEGKGKRKILARSTEWWLPNSWKEGFGGKDKRKIKRNKLQ